MPSFLEDKHEIEQVYHRYCDHIDEKQFDRLTDVFTEDTVGDYSQALGAGVVVRGLKPLLASMHQNLGEGSNCGATHHNVLNFRVTVNGDTAHAKVHYYAVHRGVRDFEGALYSMWGQYNDDLVRTKDGWRVKNRVYQCFLSEGPNVCSKPAS